MNFTHCRKAALLAMAGIALLTTAAQATNGYNPGNLLLGVHAEGNPGVTQDLVIDLGPASQFVETNTTTITVGVNLKSALDGTYGIGWPLRNDVSWSVSGTTGLNTVGSDGPKTLYATRARAVSSIQSTPWARQSDTAQGFTANKMGAMATIYNNGTLTSGVLIQPTADVNSYASYMPGAASTVANSGGISFATYAPSIEGTPAQALDLYRVVPGAGSSVFVGRFTLYSSGSVVFTPRDGAGAAFTSVQIAQATYSVPISVGNALVKIVRSGDPLVPFDVTANTTDGTALSGTHYTGVTNELISFAANEGEKTLSIPITALGGSQPTRAFTATISAPTNGVSPGAQTSTTVSIAESGPTQYALGQAGYTVNEADGTIVIHVKRLGSSASAGSVQVTTTVGSATGADFTFAPAVQTVTFDANGVSDKTVNVAIATDAATENNETFTVKLQGPTGGTLSAPNTAPVTIVDGSALTDTTAPSAPVITTPAVNALIGVNTGATLNITGSATDNKGVQVVEYRVTTPGGTPSVFTPAVLGTPGSTSTTYTASIIPVTGTNTIEVRSKDFKTGTPNVSAVVTRSFTVTRPLLVNVTGTGTLTAGFLGSTFREVGKSFTITGTPTATPAPGSIFAGWTIESAHTAQDIGIAASSLEKQTLTFIFREGLQLRATFVANPFTSVAGTYNGLIHASDTLPDLSPAGPGPEDGTSLSNSTEGGFKASVMSTGAFSGTLTVDGLTLSVAGSFDQLGHARFGTARALTVTVPRTNKPSLVAKFDVTLAAPFKITGDVTATDFKKSATPTGVATVEADRAHYTGLTGPLTVPDQYLTVTGTAPSPAGRTDGKFTVVFPALPVGNQPPGFTVADYPQGTGVGIVTVSKAGLVTITGTLADGTTVSTSTSLSEANTFSLYAQLYSKLGFISGKVKLDDSQSASDLSALDDLLWGRPFQTTQQWYPYGWPEVITVGLDGARYFNLAGSSVLKGANGANLGALDADGNADLHFNLGLLTEQIDKPLSISTTNTVTKVPDNDPTFTATINAVTGFVTGTFNHEDDTKPAYQAVIYQKGANAGAFGFFLTTKPAVIDYTGESGQVTLFGQP